jgi:hypothetical protein
MADFVLLAVTAVTALGAYLVGARRLGLPAAGLATAILRTLECVGLSLLFLLANLLIGVILVLALRFFTGRFVSMYVLNDVAIGVLAVLEAVIFRWWWRGED